MGRVLGTAGRWPGNGLAKLWSPHHVQYSLRRYELGENEGEHTVKSIDIRLKTTGSIVIPKI